MKKVVTIFGIVLLGVLVVFFLSYFVLTTPKDKGEFSISDYAEKIENVNF